MGKYIPILHQKVHNINNKLKKIAIKLAIVHEKWKNMENNDQKLKWKNMEKCI